MCQDQVPVLSHHPMPHQPQLATQLTEDKQIRVAQISSTIEHLSKEVYDAETGGSKEEVPECVICWTKLVCGDSILYQLYTSTSTTWAA